MSTDSIVGKTLNVVFLGLYNPVMKALFPGQKSPDANINTDPGQTSTYGAFITRTHGTIGQSGNIIWLEKNKLKAVVKKAKKSGKGGGAPAAGATVTYFATFAVGLCEGPIAGMRRIWVGTNLVYDAGSDDLESIIASNQALKNFKIYLGTDTQTPNSRIQADRGAANTPAYSGLAYIVVTDLALAKYGNSIQGAQIKVEVVNSQTVNSTSLISSATLSSERTASYSSTNDAVELCRVMTKDTTSLNNSVSDLRYGSVAISAPQIIPSGFIDSVMSHGLVFAAGRSLDGSLFTSSGYINCKSGASAHSYYNVIDYDGGAFVAYWRGVSAIRVARCIYDGSNTNSNSSVLNEISITGTFVQIAPTVNGCMVVTRDASYNMIATEYDKTMAVVSTSSFFVNRALYSLGPLSYSSACIWIDSSSGKINLLFPKTVTANGSFVVSYDGSSVSYLDTSIVLSSIYAFTINNNILSLYLTTGGVSQPAYFKVYKLSTPQESSVSLSTIVATEAARSSLVKTADIDATGLVDSVIGYRVTAAGSIRNALEPLRVAYPFDAYQSGYKIRFRSRGTGSVVTIPIGHLIADTQLEESREMDSQLPQRVTVQYFDRDRDYDQNEQSEERLGAESVDEQSVSIQVVMTAAHAKQTAEKLLYLAWLERYSYNFKLPPIYSGLEPSDVITIAAEYANYELRLVSANPDSDGVISCSGVPSNAAIYTSAAPADAGQQASVTIPLAGSSVMTLLDIPAVDETVQNAPGFVAAMTGYAGGWSGGTIVRSTGDGQTWDDVQGFGDKGTFGYAQAPLAANAGNLVQRGGSLTVSLLSGFVDGVTEAQMFGGSNTAAYGAHGRWEIIRFQNAALNVDGSYTLDTFWRGDKGTEWAAGLHQSGDLFVLLNDPDNAFISMSQDSIGQPRTYRAVTFDADIDSASDTSMTYAGVNLECLSPCHPSSSRDGSGNLTAKWVRRTRVGGAWRDYVDASLGETSEAYEIDVMSGTTVKRTLTSSTQSAIYSAADQVTDFGSVQAAITLRIYQLSSVVGRGYPLETTL